MEKEKNFTPQTAASAEPNNWVPVDSSTLGFQISGEPGQVVAGPDGNYYRINKPEPTLGGIAANSQNAVPTPSSIVQMPPIVQPIALVPYTSQNQPMLQYDPYSRPVDPEIKPKAPQYIKKAYRGISIAAFLFAIISVILMLFIATAAFLKTTLTDAFSMNGLDAFKAILYKFGLSESLTDYNVHIIDGNKGFIATALPILTVVVMVILAILAIKYLIRFAQKRSPRCFSIMALVNIILCLTIIILLFVFSNSEVAEELKSENLSNFIMFKSPVNMGIGLIIALISSIVLFILPFFSRKNAYVLERVRDSETYIMDNSNR